MECQSSDSKKLFHVFDASKRKRTRKKREGLDDTNSVVTDDSTSACQNNMCRVGSAKPSLHDMEASQTGGGASEIHAKRERDSSPSVEQSPVDVHRSSRSPRRHRRPAREGISLALKAGLVSTPRSITPPQHGSNAMESIAQDQDSCIYAFLEEAIKRDKKKQRHSRKYEERRDSRERDPSERTHRHHRRRRETSAREHDKPQKETIDQTVLFETFAKLCAKMNEKTTRYANTNPVQRTQSHKSLQCEVASRHDAYDTDRHPLRLKSRERSREVIQPSRIRSHENCRAQRDISPNEPERPKHDKCYCYQKVAPKCASKLDVTRSRIHTDDRYREYPPEVIPTRTCIDHCRHRDYDREVRGRNYEEDKKKYFEKMSRSFDAHREGYPDEERCRRTARSDGHKDKRYEDRDRRYDDKYYEEKNVDRERQFTNLSSRDRRSRRNLERFEKTSVASREDEYREKDYRDKDRYSERERDSGLSVADGETSTVSGKSNYLRVVKQEISEQREAMDKMMKLWKELMRCFKGISQTQGQDKAVNESAANVRESAAAQLRLWRECMRRYETVARDVGDTDARLMEEINKQRSEMTEMASMWQECLQRYRDMSNDFNSLKKQLSTPESPSRLPAPPLVCAEGEGSVPPAPYRLPHNYPPPPMGMEASAVYPGGAALRPHASAPPAWWWRGAPHSPPRSPRSPRRRSSPDSRGSRDRRHRRKDRDEPRYKEKSKPSAARSEHRHRKR